MQSFHNLAVVMGWALTILVGLLGLAVLWYIYMGKIDLSKLINEPGGGASLSRFQFLIFTFVIAMSFFLVVVSAMPTPSFPGKIDPSILALLGISGGSYLVSKGIQLSSGVRGK